MSGNTTKLYDKLASWWHILSAPEEYKEEASLIKDILSHHNSQITTLLELGSGGGNNASHLKEHYEMTLVDISPEMLSESKKLNPECEHIDGDMRNIRIGILFDAVLIHDAIMYMITEQDLRKAIETAYVHCNYEGCALFMPDCLKEDFKPKTSHGGHDTEFKSMRYLEWTYDPDQEDTSCISDFAFLLKDKNGKVTFEYDRHVVGLFNRQTWLDIMANVGFKAKVISLEHSEFESRKYNCIFGVKCK